MHDRIRNHPLCSKVKALMASEHLLDGIRRIDVALSGGADSVCLLSLLSAIVRDIPIRAHHIRHGLRDDAKDAEIARKTADLFHIDYIQTDLTWPSGIPQTNVEESARKARYEAFFSRLLPGDALALAHHGDENLETALWRMGRGCGIEGLTLAPKRVERGITLLRPLLMLSKEDIYTFLKDNALEWVEDPTNGSDQYRRNRIRHTLLPSLKQESMTESCLYQSLIDIRHDADALSSFAESFVQSCPMHFGGWFCEMNRWHSLSREAQYQVIRHAARRMVPGHCPSRSFTHEAVELIETSKESRRQIEDGRIHFGHTRTGVMMWPEEMPETPQVLLFPLPCTDYPVWQLCTLTAFRSIPQDVIKNTTSMLHIRADVLRGDLTIRPASCFVELQRSNGNLTKLSEALRSQGVPDIWRRSWPVLCDECGPLWVLGGMRTFRATPAEVNTPAVTFAVKRR